MSKLLSAISILPFPFFACLGHESSFMCVSASSVLTSPVPAASKLRPAQSQRTGYGHFTNPEYGILRSFLCDRANERTALLSVSPSPDESLPASASWRMYNEALSTIVHVTKSVVFISPLNLLLPVVPIAITCGCLQLGATTVFILNFLAIVPLSGLLGFATEGIAARLGQVAGGLVNATFGNAVELIVRKILRSLSQY